MNNLHATLASAGLAAGVAAIQTESTRYIEHTPTGYAVTVTEPASRRSCYRITSDNVIAARERGRWVAYGEAIHPADARKIRAGAQVRS